MLSNPALEKSAELVAGFEAFSSQPYHGATDRPNIWTIAFGSIFNDDGSPVTQHSAPMTRTQGLARLKTTLAAYAADVARWVHHPINENQVAALLSLSYNIGPEALETSTLLKKLNAGDVAGASAQFTVWNRSNGQVVRGLVIRRAAERHVFDTPMPKVGATIVMASLVPPTAPGALKG